MCAPVPSDLPHPPPWSDADLASPHDLADKPRRVRAMFANIARSYDLNNRLHSLARDQAWRRFAVRAVSPRPSDHVLDAACGTGDLAQAFALAGVARVTGLDFTREMLDVARRKRAALPAAAAARLDYVEGDATSLPFPAASFDVVSIAFGIRNVGDPAAALAEFARVLRPGGRLVVLEFDRPGAFPFSLLYDFYCGWLMPRTATLLSGDRSGAYRYLPRSVGAFMSRHALAHAIRNAGFRDVSARPLTLGICVCYRGDRA